MNYQFNADIDKFCELNLLPPFESWNEAAEFLSVPFKNGGAQEAIKKALTKQPAADNLAEVLAQYMNPFFKGPAIDEETIIKLIEKHAKPFTAKTEIFINEEKRGEAPGRQHKAFAEVLKVIAAGINVYLYGPAGTGKTQLAENAAAALNKPFYCISVCAQSTKSDLLGFMNAGGIYSPTLFRKAYEEGGCFLIDEIDNGNPNVLAVLNSALANGYCAFADGMIKRHPEFILIASANTFGTGPDRMYIGRNQLDAATLNRFIQIEIDYDEELEKELWPDLAATCQQYRRQLRGERVIISMRNIGNAAKLMQVGYSKAEALKLSVLNTIPENLRTRI